MLEIKVDTVKRKEALDKIQQDRIKSQEEYKLKVLNSYKRDVDELINELEIGYDIKIKDAYERGDSFCEVLFKDDKLLPRAKTIHYINSNKLFEEVFPSFICSIGVYRSGIINYVKLAKEIGNEQPSAMMSYIEAKELADDYCSGITFYFKEL